MPKASLKCLENRGTLQLLQFLAEHGKTIITDIKIDVSLNTLYRALEVLLDLELIEEERKPPVTRFVQLTGDGKEVAKYIEEIKKILDAKIEREAKRAHQ
jgi:DNA-binding transcriptional ArsR family regulator